MAGPGSSLIPVKVNQPSRTQRCRSTPNRSWCDHETYSRVPATFYDDLIAALETAFERSAAPMFSGVWSPPWNPCELLVRRAAQPTCAGSAVVARHSTEPVRRTAGRRTPDRPPGSRSRRGLRQGFLGPPAGRPTGSAKASSCRRARPSVWLPLKGERAVTVRRRERHVVHGPAHDSPSTITRTDMFLDWTPPMPVSSRSTPAEGWRRLRPRAPGTPRPGLRSDPHS